MASTDQQITLLPKWIRASKYAEISGITTAAIKAKRQQGVWLEGKHWVRAPDGQIMIDWRALDEWAESQTMQ